MPKIHGDRLEVHVDRSMKGQLDCSSSDTGVVTRSLAVLNQGIVDDKQVTVPCTIKLDKLSQSTEKLQLKDGVRYYILKKAAKQSYKIEVHRVLRTRNQSMPSAIQKPSRMNRPDPRDQRFRYFSPARGSGIKRPLHSPPNEYDKQRRFENQFHGGFQSRGRGGHDLNSRRPWSHGGSYVHRESRGGYRGHSPGASFGQRSYSSDDPRRNRNRVPSPESYSNRPHRSEKSVTANDSYRNSDHQFERKRHKSVQDSIRGKSLIDTYHKSSDHSNASKNMDEPEKKHISVQDNTLKSKRELKNNTLAEKAVVNKIESKGASTEAAKGEATTSPSNCNEGDQSLSNSNDVTVCRTTKKTHIFTMSQIEPQGGIKPAALPKATDNEKDPDIRKMPEPFTTHSNTNCHDLSKSSAHGTEISVSSDLSTRTKTNINEAKSAQDVKQNVTSTPVKVHSARKSAPSSTLSRTQRKEMLQKQALLKAQNTSGPVISNSLLGSPKAKMGSNSIQPKSGTVSHIDKEEHITSGTRSPVKEAFTPPRCEDIVVLSDTEEEENKKNDVHLSEESSKERMEISKVDSSDTAKLVIGETAESSTWMPHFSDPASICAKSSESQVASHDNYVTGDIQLSADTTNTKEVTKSGRDKAVRSLAGENSKDTEKAPSNKQKALQKIKDNLKKNLQKGRTSPQNLSPSKSGELPPADSSPGSPTQQTDDSKVMLETAEIQPAKTERAERTQESSATMPAEESFREDNSNALDVDSQLVQNSSIDPSVKESVTSLQMCRDLVDNIVAALIADDMLNDSQNLSHKGDNSVVSKTPNNSDSAVCDVPATSPAETLKENSFITSTNLHVTASAKSKPQDKDVSQKIADGEKPLEKETSQENMKVVDNLEDSIPQDSDRNTVDNLSDISVDLGPEEPDDMTCNDDHLLEDEPVVAEIEDFDAGISEISITCVESQCTDEPGAPQKRALPEAECEEDGMPVSKKSKADSEEGVQEAAEEGSSTGGTLKESAEQTGTFLDGGESPVVFTTEEWRVFALSIKEKYEKLVQTFKQKTNEMYEAQARWQHENLLLKEKYHDLKQKYEHLSSSVGENPTIKKQTVEVQTFPVWQTPLSRKKRNPSQQTSVNNQSASTLDPGKNAKPNEDAGTNPSSGTAPNISTSEQNPSAASGTKDSSASPTTSTSNAAPPKGSNLEAKRQNFKATLSKVIQSKKGESTGESGSVPASPSGQALSSGIQGPSPSNPFHGTPEGESEVVPMDTTSVGPSSEEPVEQTTNDGPKCVEDTQQPENSGTTNAATTSTDALKSKPAEMPVKETNAASTTSIKDTTASHQPQTNASKPSTSTDISKPPSQSSQSTSAASTKEASNDANKDPPGTKTAISSEIHKDHSTGSSFEVSETSTTSSETPKAAKSSSLAESSNVSDTSAEPEIIDLTDDPDPPVTTKPQSMNSHKTGPPAAAKQSPLTTRSPHTLVSAPSPSISLPSRTTTSVTPSKRISSSASTSSNGRQNQTTPQNMQSTSLRSGQQSPTAVPLSLRPRSGSTGSASSGKGSPGVPPSSSPQRPFGTTHNTTPVQGMSLRPNASTTSAANVQLRNINPPAVSVQGQGTNMRSAVVALQHGTGQQMPSQETSTQVLPGVQQRSGQVITSTTPAVSVTVVHSQQGPIRTQGQVPVQARVQQQQQNQQISLQMLQQQRQGVHQLPGAAASAAALATRQPQMTWIQQQRPQQVTNASQVVQVVQQQVGQHQVLTPAQMQMQVMSAPGITNKSSSQGQANAIHNTRQQQQQFQGLPRGPTNTQEQIQAQERTRAMSQAQAKEKALRQQREQEQQHAARQAAASLQSTQASQQEVKRARLRKLHQERLEAQQNAQTQQGRVLMLKEQILRTQSYQQNLKNKLKNYAPGIDPSQIKSIEKQWAEVQDQERKLNGELAAAEERQKASINKSKLLDQQISLLSGATSSSVSQQELQKKQLQQLQQQQQQLQQQINRQIQQQQKRQQPPEKKHPADLPDLFALPDIPPSSRYTPSPLCPLLEIKHSPEGIVLSWKMRSAETSKVEVKRYLLYAYQESESATPSTDLWKKIGAVEALPLPMACTLTHFKAGSMYHFAVCAISKHDRPGQFSNIGSINLP